MKIMNGRVNSMGYRANTVTVHREYGSQPFSDWEAFVDKFIPALEEKGSMYVESSEDGTYFEVYTVLLRNYMEELPDNDKVSDYPHYTNKELKQVLQEAIDETPGKWLAWEWF